MNMHRREMNPEHIATLIADAEKPAEILEWFVSEGQRVERDQPLCEMRLGGGFATLFSSIDGRVERLIAVPGVHIPAGYALATLAISASTPTESASRTVAASVDDLIDDSATIPMSCDELGIPRSLGPSTLELEGDDIAAQRSTRPSLEVVRRSFGSLCVVGPQGEGEHHVVHAPNLRIGRALDCDVVLQDALASRHHAQLVFNGDRVILTDLQSNNGTTVNDQPISQVLLEDGDHIVIGDHRVVFLLADERPEHLGDPPKRALEHLSPPPSSGLLSKLSKLFSR